jgi:hypothetical protein
MGVVVFWAQEHSYCLLCFVASVLCCSLLVLLFVLLCYWSLQISFGICFVCCCPLVGNGRMQALILLWCHPNLFFLCLDFAAVLTDFVYWGEKAVRLLIGGCCFLLRWRLSLLQIWCRSPSRFFLENHRGFVFFRGTASEHSILFVLVTGSGHFCVEAIEQVHTYVLPFWLHSPFFPLQQACDLFHFPL